MEGYREIGTFTKPHGYKGKLIAFVDLPEKIKFLEPVFVEFQQILVPFFIESYSYKSPSLVIFKFTDVDDEKLAENFRKKKLYVTQSFYDDNIKPKTTDLSFIGYTVIDIKYGCVGVVADVLKYPSQHILKIFDEHNNEILIPFNDTFVTDINEEEKTIHTAAPDGLIQLYLL